MWLFTKYGFYSIVKKPFPDVGMVYQVRARVKNDLENLKKAAGLDNKVYDSGFTDYRYRILANDEEYQKIMDAVSKAVDYPNFKSEVAKHKDQDEKLICYHKVWGAMMMLQR